MAVPWKWGLVAVAVVNVVTAYVQFEGSKFVVFVGGIRVAGRMISHESSEQDMFVEMFAAMNMGRWPPEMCLLSINFMMAPLLACLVIRACVGRMGLAERIVGYGVAAVCVMPVLFLLIEFAKRLAQGSIGSGRGPLFTGVWCLSMCALIVGGILAWRAQRNFQGGIDSIVLLMACYLANACWALLAVVVNWHVGTYIGIGAVMCIGVSLWFIVEMGLMWVRDRAWRRAELYIRG